MTVEPKLVSWIYKPPSAGCTGTFDLLFLDLKIQPVEVSSDIYECSIDAPVLMQFRIQMLQDRLVLEDLNQR